MAMDRNLRQFQFVLFETTSTISSIVLGGVTIPYALAFEPKTHLFYTTDKPVEDMNTDDWRDFLTNIITGKTQAQGGRGFFRQMYRALYGLTSSILDIWKESRVLFGVVVVIPLFVMSIVFYTLCCMSWGEEPESEQVETSDSELEEEVEGKMLQQEQKKQTIQKKVVTVKTQVKTKKKGHLKAE